MGWGYDAFPRTAEELLQVADAAVNEFMKAPWIQRMLAAADAAEAAEVAAAPARLAAGIRNLRMASLLVGSAELLLTVGVPLAVWVGVFAALGAPYLEA